MYVHYSHDYIDRTSKWNELHTIHSKYIPLRHLENYNYANHICCHTAAFFFSQSMLMLRHRLLQPRTRQLVIKRYECWALVTSWEQLVNIALGSREFIHHGEQEKAGWCSRTMRGYPHVIGSLGQLRLLGCDILDQVNHTAAVAEFIVIPESWNINN